MWKVTRDSYRCYIFLKTSYIFSIFTFVFIKKIYNPYLAFSGVSQNLIDDRLPQLLNVLVFPKEVCQAIKPYNKIVWRIFLTIVCQGSTLTMLTLRCVVDCDKDNGTMEKVSMSANLACRGRWVRWLVGSDRYKSLIKDVLILVSAVSWAITAYLACDVSKLTILYVLFVERDIHDPDRPT